MNAAFTNSAEQVAPGQTSFDYEANIQGFESRNLDEEIQFDRKKQSC
jgi:hypothetical protein